MPGRLLTRRPRFPAGATGVILVDLAQLAANWQALARHVAPAECGAVVKADAYGVGAARVIPALYEAGCRSFFVATLDEAAHARELVPGAAVYVLDGLLPGTARDLARLGVIPALTNLEDVRTWSVLADNGTRAPAAALHVDTGLHRLGMSAKEVRELARDTALLRRLDIALVMSHLACADEAAHPMNREQLDVFHRLRSGLPPARASLAASDGLMLGVDFHLDLVRPGYALYGGQAAPGRPTPVEPIVRVKARILQVHDVSVGGAHRLLGKLSRDKPAAHRHHCRRLCRRRVPPRQRHQRDGGRLGCVSRQARAHRRARLHGSDHRRRDGTSMIPPQCAATGSTS